MTATTDSKNPFRTIERKAFEEIDKIHANVRCYEPFSGEYFLKRERKEDPEVHYAGSNFFTDSKGDLCFSDSSGIVRVMQGEQLLSLP